MKFSEIEIEHLLKSWVAISLAFAIMLSKGDIISSNFTLMLLVSGLTVGVGFIAHELGHKLVAQRYHCFAEFRASNFMLVIAVLMSFLGFIFAAPGAVIISGYVTKERNGKISLAGPVVNLILAFVFMILYLTGTFVFAAKYGLMINAWLAVFNLIPILNFDGKKILAWNKLAYYITLLVSIGLLIIAFNLK